MQRKPIPNRKAVASVIALLCTCLVLVACGSSSTTTKAKPNSPAGFPVTIHDTGQSFTFDKPPRILVDQAYDDYLVAAAGGNITHRIVAQTNDPDVPLGSLASTMADVPRLSTDSFVSKETIVGEQPNVVLTHGLNTTTEQNQVSALGIKVIIPNICWQGYAAAHGGKVPYSAVYSDILQYGRLLGTESFAQKSVAGLKAIVNKVQHEKPLRGTIAFADGLFQGSMYVFGGPDIVTTMAQTLGGSNAFGNVPTRITSISNEAFLARNPDYLVAGYYVGPGGVTSERAAIAQYQSIPGFDELKAVREHHVLYINGDYLVSQVVQGDQLIHDAFAGSSS